MTWLTSPISDGLIAHGSHEADGHLVVNDVWESRGHFDRFVDERLQAAMYEALGDRASEPEVVEREMPSFRAREIGLRSVLAGAPS